MHGCIRKWLWAMFAVAALGDAPAIVQAQQEVPAQYVGTAYADPPAADAAAKPTGAAGGDQADAGDKNASGDQKATDADKELAARVKKLEDALKKAEDKAAVDKAAAAAKMSAEVHGMIQLDEDLFNQSPLNRAQFGDVQDGVAFRRVRIWVSGSGFDIIDYKLEVDFAPFLSAQTGSPYVSGGNIATSPTTFSGYLEQVGARDVYVEAHDLAYLGHVRMGHFKEPFGLEQLTSDRFITFMERSMGDEGCFVPARGIGVMAWDTYDNLNGTWAAGAFRVFTRDVYNSDSWVRQSDNGGTAFTGRITYLPWYDECTNGRGLLHLGAAYSYRDMDTVPGATSTNFLESVRPESYLGPTVASVNLADVEHYELLGGEAALVYGPFSLQSEYFGCWLRHDGGVEDYQWGGYAFVSYFLTGENRVYNRQGGFFDRVRPFENFFRVRGDNDCVYTGSGAWEVAYRWSYVDLDLPVAPSGTTNGQGGIAIDHTFGVNWYLNPYLRFMWNYVHTDCDPIYRATNTGRSSLDTFEMRMSFDF